MHTAAMKRTNAYLDKATIDGAKVLGLGNMSEGLREAVHRALKEKTGEIPPSIAGQDIPKKWLPQG